LQAVCRKKVNVALDVTFDLTSAKGYGFSPMSCVRNMAKAKTGNDNSFSSMSIVRNTYQQTQLDAPTLAAKGFIVKRPHGW
jgi:hypothetical protein